MGGEELLYSLKVAVSMVLVNFPLVPFNEYQLRFRTLAQVSIRRVLSTKKIAFHEWYAINFIALFSYIFIQPIEAA